MLNASDTILNNLNAKQREAVESIEGPLLVLAGPGSGKTRVITHRIAYLTRVFGVAPRNVLAVTFTNKAAKEMSERLESLIGTNETNYRNPTVGTFHSLGVQILRSYGDRIGINKDFVIYDQADQLSTIRRSLDQLGLDPKRYNPNITTNMRTIFRLIHARKPIITIVMIASLHILISFCKLEAYVPVYPSAA